MAPSPLPTPAAATAAALPISPPPPAPAFLRRRLLSSGASSTSRRRGWVSPARSFSSRKCNLHHQKLSRQLGVAAGRIRCSQLKLEDGVDDETCELVNGVDLVIGEGEDSIRAYLLKAVKNNNGTGVLLLSDSFGFEDSSTREFAYRVACSGYNQGFDSKMRGGQHSSTREPSPTNCMHEHHRNIGEFPVIPPFYTNQTLNVIPSVLIPCVPIAIKFNEETIEKEMNDRK